MPRKIRELKALISRAGYVLQVGRGKGSHTRWEHPLLPEIPLTIPGKDGDDAKPYLEKQVSQALKTLRQLQETEEEE